MKNQTHKYREQTIVARGEGKQEMGKMSEEEWKIQTFSYG